MVNKRWIYVLALFCPLLISAQDFNDAPDLSDENYVALLFPKPKAPEKEVVLNTSSPSINLALTMVDYGQQFLGMRYRIGGVGSNGGFDCSGLVQRLFKEIGVELPRSSLAMANYGQKIELTDVRTGDLLFFTGRNSKSSHVGHVAMVTNVTADGGIEIIHATNHGGVMIENPFKNQYFAPRYLFAARVLN